MTGQDEKRLFKDLVEKAKYKLVPTRENRFWAVDWNKLVGDWNREVKKQLRIGGGGSILFLKTATHPMDYNKQKQSDTTAFNTMNAPSGVPGKSHMDLSKEVRDGLRSETAVVQQAFKPAPTAAPPTAPRDGGIRPPPGSRRARRFFLCGSRACCAQVNQAAGPAEPEYMQPVRWEQGGAQAEYHIPRSTARCRTRSGNRGSPSLGTAWVILPCRKRHTLAGSAAGRRKGNSIA